VKKRIAIVAPDSRQINRPAKKPLDSFLATPLASPAR